MECESVPINASSFAVNVSPSTASFAVNLSRKSRRMRARPISNASRYTYDYLVDVLLRVNQHPASRVEELTPRQWKTRFADNPMRSDLQQITP